MITTTPSTIHPRRLFCSASPVSEVDATSCLKPSIIAEKERQGRNPPLLLAPSPKSPAVLRTHVEIGVLQEDVESLVDYIKTLAFRIKGGSTMESITLASQDTSCLRSSNRGELKELFVNQLEPLKDALEQLEAELVNPNMTCTAGIQTDDVPQSFIETPRNRDQSTSLMTDSRMLSADLAHLRTIQKEVRGLFVSKTSSSSSGEDPQTATKISRMLASQSGEIGGFSQLTLSPTTEIFEKVKTNPWFNTDRRRRSGSLPNLLAQEQDAVVITDSPISTIAPISAAVTNREILANDDSMTISALQSAMARKRTPRSAGTADLVTKLRRNDPDNKKRLNNVYRNFPDSSIYRN
jgi:hypothetical protein